MMCLRCLRGDRVINGNREHQYTAVLKYNHWQNICIRPCTCGTDEMTWQIRKVKPLKPLFVVVLLGFQISKTTINQEHVASLLPETCEWNTYMCCWTAHDGPGIEVANSDVCRVTDYPEAGDVLEMPRDAEGPVYW